MRRQEMKIEVTFYEQEGDEMVEVVREFPARWAICPACEGCGTDRGRSVECDGGGFTASEWMDQDEDFREGYLAGVYDRPCNECRGHAGRVLVIDRCLVSPQDLAAYDQHQQEEYEYRRMCEQERRFGA